MNTSRQTAIATALLALCALFALNAEARTIYVDAKRPNNNGNGLSAKKAKKTIQAAINVAKKGDTILVLPGTYAPIRTNNKKVAIKSVKGRAKTSIVQPSKKNGSFALASLGKVFTYKGTGRDAQFRVISVVCKSAPVTKGTASKLTGFLLDGKRRSASRVIGVTGGTVKACSIRGLGHLDRSGDWLTIDEASAAVNSKLTVCEILDNQYATTGTGLVSGSILQRCSIRNNRGNGYSYSSGRVVSGSKLYNCLVAGNSADAEAVPVFSESLLINCTVADNALVHRASSVKFSKSSKWFNCVLRDNRSQRKTVRYEYGYYDWLCFRRVLKTRHATVYYGYGNHILPV